MTMNPDTMTLHECRDAIAEAMGYTPVTNLDLGRIGWTRPDGRDILHHPLPATLDAIAGSLPEGWLWNEIRWFNGSKLWSARVYRFDPWDADGADADTELLARARASLKAWLRVREEMA